MNTASKGSELGDDIAERSDEELVVAMHAGDDSGYAILWARHSAAGRRAAKAISSSYDPDDLVSEAFASILSAIQGGGGPTGPFRPYLFATIRNISATWSRKGTDLPLDALPETAFTGEEPDPLDRLSTRTSLMAAFRRLPERQRTLLWYLEVEGMKPREVAPLMGLSPNAVSALAYRAREGFRQAWLEIHIANPDRPADCRWVCERVLVQGKRPLGRNDRARFAQHLATCRACQIVASDIEEVSQRLRLVMLPLLLGGAAAATYAADTTPAMAAVGVWAGGEAVQGSGVPVVAARSGQETTIFDSSAAVSAEPSKYVGVAVGVGAALTAVAAAGALAVLVASASWAPAEVTTAQPPARASSESEQPMTMPAEQPPVPVPADVAPAEERAAEPGVSVRAQTAPSPNVTSTPVPPPSSSVPLELPTPVHVFALTSLVDLNAPIPAVLEGTGIPGATVLIEDENGVTLTTTEVESDGTFQADVSGNLLHQGLTLTLSQTVAGAASAHILAPLGPFAFPVPTLVGFATGGNLASVDGPGEGGLDDAIVQIDGLLDETVLLSLDKSPEQSADDDPDQSVVAMVSTPTTVLLSRIRLGSYTAVLRYVDPATGRTGLASRQHVVFVAASVGAE